MKKLLLLMLTISLAKPSFALDLGFAKEDAGHAGTFLDFAASARSMAMGRAHAGIADDASAGYWNPSGLTQLERQDLVTSYSALEEDTGFGFVSYGQPTLDWGTFGLSVVSLRSGDFDGRDQAGLPTGSFDQSELGVIISHALPYKERWSFGSSIKVVRQEIQSFDDIGYGLDIGTMFDAHRNIQLGLTVKNLVAPKLKLKKNDDTYPMDIRLGSKFQTSKNLLFALDLNQTQNRSVKLHLGTEYTVKQIVALRAGLNEAEVTAGLGIKLGDWSLDYAFGYQDAVNGEDDLGGNHRFGFHVQFGNYIRDEKTSVRRQKLGQDQLSKLRNIMDQTNILVDGDTKSLADDTRSSVRRRAYNRPVDLYSAQGYIYFIQGDYKNSVESLYQAEKFDPNNAQLKEHLAKARARLSIEERKEILSSLLKKVRESYKNGDHKVTVETCKEILHHDPQNVEALTYLEDAQSRIEEPINRELRIAQGKISRRQYLEAMKHLLKVKELDPENKEVAGLMNTCMSSLKEQATLQAIQPNQDQPRVFEVGQNPEKSRELYTQGLSYYSQGKIKDALQMWKQAIKHDSLNSLALNAYNRALLEIQEEE